MEKTIQKQECSRCGLVFWPRIDDKTNEVILPVHCKNKKCNSPYWNVPIERQAQSRAVKKFQKEKREKISA